MKREEHYRQPWRVEEEVAWRVDCWCVKSADGEKIATFLSEQDAWLIASAHRTTEALDGLLRTLAEHKVGLCDCADGKPEPDCQFCAWRRQVARSLNMPTDAAQAGAISS